MVSLTYLPVANAVDVVVENFHSAAAPSTPITDAVFSFTLYASGIAVAGCDGVSMSHAGSGTYRGAGTPTTDLTAGAKYHLRITCTNYDVQWDEWFVARPRLLAD